MVVKTERRNRKRKKEIEQSIEYSNIIKLCLLIKIIIWFTLIKMHYVCSFLKKILIVFYCSVLVYSQLYVQLLYPS